MSSSSFNEWLPNGLAGSTSTANKKPGFASAVRTVQVAIAPAREHASTAASAAGIQTNTGSDTCCPSLTFRERVQGCVACILIGFVISFLGFISFWTGHVATFAILYTLGNIISICSSGFLFGPMRQLRNMGRAKRRVAVAIYLGAMLLTLVLAFCLPKVGPLILISVFAQWCALVWYIASYIPFGQKIISKTFKRVTEF